MKRVILILAVLLLAASALPGRADAEATADWRFFHNSGDNSMLYYDMESVTAPAKGVANVWTKLEVKAKVFSLTLYEFSCVDRRFRMLIKHGFDNVNNVIIPLPNSDETYPTRWTYVVPDTFEAKLVKLACSSAK
ncbi:MAG: hypothetical protein A3J24_04305 [Deltaproteobacteria bacterium RIFCSPLOWO2_02_FULL_53_8]|nr:MAG: hypothetical protein A3J24_04305 [Deltaproteobacteria bacterium RIFCSPLOWO2_02_FULL_53_8]